jgi:hypothetical protein
MIHAAKIDWVEAKHAADVDQLLFQDEDGNAVMTLDVPAGLLRDFITANAEAAVYAAPDGTLHTAIEDPEFLEVESRMAIDELVARDVAPEMLEDEPNVKSALLLFEQRLKRSIDLVAAAIKGLDAQET